MEISRRGTAARRADRLITGVALVAGGATVVVVVAPFLRFAYESLALHVSLETGEALIGALLAGLALARSRITALRSDAVLAGSLGLLAITNLLLATVPNIAADERVTGFAVWAASGWRLVGVAGIASASLLVGRMEPSAGPDRRRRGLAASAAGLVVVLVLALLADGLLGEPIDPDLDATASRSPAFAAHPVLLVVQGVGVLLYATAVVGFRRGAHEGDQLRLWLAVGCVLGAFSRLHYLLFASLYTTWVSTGDVLRLAAYLAFLVGAYGEIRSYWQARVEVGADRERRRIARDLHDGLAQELSFIRSQTAAGGSRADSAAVAEAAARALLESRRLIQVLHDHESVDVEAALREVCEAVALRAGAEVTVRAPVGAVLPPAALGVVTSIVREATTNAIAHGGATRIDVALAAHDGQHVLRVTDDGRGFDVERPTHGFGLRSMRTRVGELGGTITIDSTRGEGTAVVARW